MKIREKLYAPIIKMYLSIVMLAVLFGCQVKQTGAGNHTQPLKRYVSDNVLVSNALPKIKIAVDREFRYVGSFYFEIIASSDEYPEEMRGKAVAAGDRYVFVAADENQKIRKMFIVQLEGFLPDNDFIYHYKFDNAELIGGNEYRHNTWFYDSRALDEENPNSESAKTRAFLEEKGYSYDDEQMMSRFVGLASEDRKNEIILFYIEMLKEATGYSLDQLEHSVATEEAQLIERAFVSRSRESFKINLP